MKVELNLKKLAELVEEKPVFGWILFGATMFVTFLLGLFASSVMERRVESRAMFQVVAPVDEMETRSDVWGNNYPREYERWKMTRRSDFKSKYNGSAVRDSLAEHPAMVVLWAGYAFSREYNQARGHMHAVEDVKKVLRTGVPQPGTCWTCKSTQVVPTMRRMGLDNYYGTKWEDLYSTFKESIGCLDCHDPKTMDLQVKRPALVEAFNRRGKDIRKATHQELRSLVCAQCHVEYYFKDKKHLTFPWDKGLAVEDMEKYYDGIKHVDFVNPLSKARMLKAQHPDWELAQTGIHFQRGLSCADCHMPYRAEGGVKFTDHWVQSPLNNMQTACMVCHNESAATLRKNVEDRQDRIQELRGQAEDALVRAHIEAKAAWKAGATEAEMADALLDIRHSQWRWDFVSASIGAAFHAPLECARILGSSINLAQEARLKISRVLVAHGVTGPVPMPDISTKAKAQAFIGLDMEKLRAEKDAQIKRLEKAQKAADFD